MCYLAARLMATWQDSLEEQQQYPALLGLTADQALAFQQQRMPTDEPVQMHGHTHCALAPQGLLTI